MATLHLQTDLPRLSVAQAGQPSTTTTSRSHPNEADYAAITPTAARPHPEKGYTSLFDMHVPPQYAYEHARESFRATSTAGSMMGYHAGGELPFIPAAMAMGTYSQQNPTYSSISYEQTPNDLAFSSSCSEDSCSSSAASSICTGGPQTPPERASPASSFAAVPGNTIYNAYMQHQVYAQVQSGPPMQQYTGRLNGPALSMVANNHAYPVCSSNSNVNGTQEYAASYAPSTYGQLQYAPYQPAYHQTNQYAIYNGNELSGQVPARAHPPSAQVSPNVVYDTQINEGSLGHAMNSNILPVTSVSGNNMDNSAILQPAHSQPIYQDHQPSFTPGHGHSVSQNSISTRSLHNASPAPSLSGSDDSGNTSKSTLFASSAGLVVKSNPSSRRCSVSSVTSNVGTPYAGSNKKDGDRKFVCSYPGCKRSFSRNFNLSTHYNTHLGIKPFPCSHCPKSFSRRHDCARHIAAVHVTESKNGHSMHDSSAEDGSISPNTCGCGHTCPAHAKNVTSFSTPSVNGQVVSNSAFAFIKGHHNANEDDYSTSSSGYESTTSTQSFDSFISDNFNGLVNNNRSPSIGTFSNASLDFGLVKIEDREGE